MPLRFVGIEVLLHSFLPLALGGSESSASHSRKFTAGEQAPYYPLSRKMCVPQLIPVLKKRKPSCPCQKLKSGLSSP